VIQRAEMLRFLAARLALIDERAKFAEASKMTLSGPAH
jgi:hypothetical protein